MSRHLFYLTSLLAMAMLTLAAPFCSPAAAQNGEQVIHVVQPGENLFRISLRYNTSIEEIMAANGLTDARVVYAGQQLVIPQPGGQAAEPELSVYQVQPGDTLSSIALRHGVTLWSLMDANGLVDSYIIYPGQLLQIPGGAGETSPAGDGRYLVRAGDTLYRIARQLDTTVTALAQANGIANPATIYVGQNLRLPGIVAGADKRILVDLSEQHLYAYEGDSLVYSFVASSGAGPTYTRTGEFQVQSKIPNAYGSVWDIWMPHWLGIYWAGGSENGIHALPIMSNGQTLWAGYLGRPISYGCIVLGSNEARLLYAWADLGTPVSIQY